MRPRIASTSLLENTASIRSAPWWACGRLAANLGYFQGDEDGSERAGKLDNKTYSGLFDENRLIVSYPFSFM